MKTKAARGGGRLCGNEGHPLFLHAHLERAGRFQKCCRSLFRDGELDFRCLGFTNGNCGHDLILGKQFHR